MKRNVVDKKATLDCTYRKSTVGEFAGKDGFVVSHPAYQVEGGLPSFYT